MSSGTAAAAGVVVVIIILLALSGAAYYIHRRRQHTHPSTAPATSSARPHTFIDPSHPACRVTPFGSPGPRFGHHPGENMRVARRTPSGSWAFTDFDPHGAGPALTLDIPFTPYALRSPSFSVPPSPSASFSSRTTLNVKEKFPPGALTTRGFIEPDHDGLLPPAYHA